MKSEFFSNYRLITYQFYLILSIPFLLITGPFLSDLVVVLISIFFLIYVIKNKEFNYFKSAFFKLFSIVYLYLIIISIFSDHSLFSLKSSLPYFRFCLLSLSLWLVLDNRPYLIKYLFFILLIIYTFLIFDGLKQFFTKENFFGMYLASGHRVTSLFGEEAKLGSYLARFFPLFFACLIYVYKLNKKKIYFFYFSVVFILTDILIFITAERTALFIVNFAAILLIFLLSNFKKLRFYSLITSILAFLLISVYYPAAKIRIVDQTLNQIGFSKKTVQNFLSDDETYKEHIGVYFKENERFYIFSEQYDNIYRTSIKIFNENKIFGIGPKNFRKYCDSPNFLIGNGCSTHPHNTYIQILTESGIIGLILISLLFLLFVYSFISHFYKLYFNRKPYFSDFEISLMICIFITLWPIIPGGNFFNNWLSIVYFYPVGFLIWSLKKNKIIN